MLQLDSFWGYENELGVDIQATSLNQLCIAENDTQVLLNDLKAAVNTAILNVESQTAPGSETLSVAMCPDSLMAIGENCVDVYIAALKPPSFFFGTLAIGNGRGSDPYAGIQQSKFQFVPHFDTGKMNLLINGSSISGDVPLPSWLSTTPLHFEVTVPATPFQIETFTVSAPTADKRVVVLKIVNADCALLQGMASQQSLPVALVGKMVDLFCPAIDMTLTYSKINGLWPLTYVSRDAYPTLEVIEKTPTGLLKQVHMSPESKNFWGGLMGLYKFNEQVQREYNLLDQDQQCFTY